MPPIRDDGSRSTPARTRARPGLRPAAPGVRTEPPAAGFVLHRLPSRASSPPRAPARRAAPAVV